MNRNKYLGFAFGILIAAAINANGQSAYSTAVNSLTPAGYWPMHEAELAAQGDTETNYGTLGRLGTGFYPDWASPALGIFRGVPGVITNDNGTAVSFTRGASPANGTYTNGVYVPHISPLSTLNPPFSVECWYYPTDSASSDDIWAQNGSQGLNQGSAGAGSGSVSDYGLRLVWGNGTGASQKTGFELFTCDGVQNTAGFAGNTNVAPGNTAYGPTNQSDPLLNWYDVVVTCDANTNWNIYVNGVQQSLTMQAVGAGGIAFNGAGSYSPDYWTPITVGSGKGGSRALRGYVDEFSVYTNVISDIPTHYNDGIGGAAGQYFYDVTNDNPVIYLRMDAPPTYTVPAIGTWPALMNSGTTNGVAVGNGVYTPGTAPGLVTGRPVNPNGVSFAGISGNLAPLNGMSSFGDAGNVPLYNPTGSNTSFTVSALFRGYPCDNRIQSIVSHGTNSWALNVTTNGHVVFNAGNGNKAAGGTSQAAGDISTIGVYNDGNWHHVVAINQTNQVSIYVDGVLDTNGIPTGITGTNFIVGNTRDVMIGSDPTYTNNPSGAGRQFAGQICDVAFWTNALTVNQIQMLYSNCGVAPFIVRQPVSASVNQGQAFTNVAAAEGSSLLTYQWYTNGTALAGQTNSSLILNPAATSNTSMDYYLIVNNLYGSATSAIVSITVFGPPVFTNQLPITYNSVLNTNFLTLYAGANPNFSLAGVGAQPITYYWFTNGVYDGAQNNNNLTLANVRIGTLNVYSVASNAVGMATSAVWTASVIADPTNSSNGLAPYPQQVLAGNPVGYWRLNEGNDNNNGDDGYVALDYASGNDGLYTNMILGESAGYSPTTDPSDLAAIFAGFGSIPAFNSLAGQIRGVDFAATNGANGEFTVEAWANGVSGGEPQILGGPLAAKGIFGVDDQFNLGIDTTLTHYRFYMRSANGTVYVVGSANLLPLDNRWHHFVGVCDETNGLLSLYGDGRLLATTSVPTNSGVYEDPEPMTIGAGTSDGINYSNQFNGYINDVAVYNYAMSASQVASNFTAIGVEPLFVQPPPATVSLTAGGTLSIPATAIGSDPLNYTWADVSGGTNVATGSTNGLPLNASLTVSNVPGVWNNDQLKLTVNNTYGSTNFLVTVIVNTNAPQIALNLPSPVTIVSGQSYLYSIAIGASTVPPYYYQWYNGSTLLANQTNATYTATAGSPGSTTYFVTISNAFGVTTSTISTFTSISVPSAPTSGYATNMLGLHPAGYWPMHEVESAPAGDTEHNYGSLGLLGTGYYPDWVANYGGILRQQPGALGGDSDTADAFTYGTGNAGNTVSYTNGLYVPHTSPLTTLNPPFSVECWFYPTNTPTGEAIWAQEGAAGLNQGASGDLVNFSGIMLNWANSTFVPYGYNGETNGNLTSNNGDKLEAGGNAGGSPNEAIDHWYHVVVTCDANTNFTLYVNGVNVVGPSADVGKYAPDSWTPITIGSGNGGIRSSAGSIDEFAVYTNVISDISTHYTDGTSGGPGAYFNDVINDNPVIYLRMDAQPYTAPSTNAWAELFNYGSAGTNGFYTPGTEPNVLSGPLHTNGAPFNGLSGLNTTLFSGISSFADAGSASAFNPTGSSANFTVLALFRGNPCDNRVQTIAGHGTNSWQLNVTTNGCIVFNAGNGNTAVEGTGQASGDISTKRAYNDGNWHQVAAVNQANVVSIYVDGALDTNGTPTGITPSSVIPGNASDVMIGADPNFTNNPTGVGRQFAGQICDVAFFTNALTAGQIGVLYSVTGTNIPPFFAPAPSASATASIGGTLVVPAGAAGTTPLNYQWQIITNSGTNLLVTGLTNSLPLNATLTVNNVPATWNGGQLEVTVANAYGTNSAFVTLSVVNPVNPNPTNIVATITNGLLYLSWPGDHTGWQLQAQTNSVSKGIGNNWVNYNPSTGTNLVVIPINLTNGTVFYRLTY